VILPGESRVPRRRTLRDAVELIREEAELPEDLVKEVLSGAEMAPWR